MIRAIAAGLALLALSLPAHAETGLASWQGREIAGRRMANGQRYRPSAPTCASRTHPLGTVLDVSLLDRTTRCWVTDQGPYVGGRAIDLSQAGARELGIGRRGVVRVTITEVAMAPDVKGRK